MATVKCDIPSFNVVGAGHISQIDKLDEFQRFCKETDDENLIAQKSRELFVLDIPGSEATIQSVIDDYEEIQE